MICESFNGITPASIAAFKTPRHPLSYGAACVVFWMMVCHQQPLSFLLSSLSPPHWILCWPWKKSTSSFYFMTFHIWTSMFWFLSLIISHFIKFNFIFNFIIGFITLIFNFFKFDSHSLYFYFLFGFFCEFDFYFQFCPSIQSFMMFNVRSLIFWFQILIFSPFITF